MFRRGLTGERARLLDDPELRIQEHAFSLLRNLAFGRVADIDMVVSCLGEDRLISVLETRLRQHCTGALSSAAVTKAQDANDGSMAERLAAADRVAHQAVYVVVNIATGTEKHKMLVANASGLIRIIVKLLVRPALSLVLPTVTDSTLADRRKS